MKRSIKFLILSVLVLGLIIPVVNLHAKPAATVTINFWHTMNEEETVTLQGIVDDFEAANTDIEVEVKFVDFWEAHDAYANTFEAGGTPDVFRSEIMWTPEFADLGRLEPLDNVYTSSEWNDFLEAPLNTGKFDGKQYGVPQVTDCLALLYNKHQAQMAGVDPTGFADLSAFKTGIQKLGENHSQGQYGFTFGPMTYWYFPFMWGKGGDFFTGDYTVENIAINSSGSVAGLKYVKELIEDPTTPARALQVDYGAAVRDFKYGNVSMAINGPWQSADYLTGPMFNATAYEEEFTETAPTWVGPENFGITVIPGDAGKKGSPVGGHNYVLAKSSEHKTEAKKLIKYLTSVEANVEFADKNNLLPVRLSAYDDTKVKSNAILNSFKAQLEVAQTRAVVPYWGDLDGPLADEIGEYLAGNKTAQEALNAAAAKWATVINEYLAEKAPAQTPGFELIFALGSILGVVVILRKRKSAK